MAKYQDHILRTMAESLIRQDRGLQEEFTPYAIRDAFSIIDSLEAENERLRTALEEIALPCAAEAVGRQIPHAVTVARRALGGQDER